MKKQSLGSRIKDLRESRNMTQAELAKLLFVSDKTVSKWEKGNSDPETNILIKMAEVFDVTLDYLLTGTTKEKDTKVISRIELACREDNIALLDGLDIEAFDEHGKNLEFYAKQYDAKNIKNYLLNYKIDKYVQNNKISRKYHICALPKGSTNEEDLELVAWDGPYSKAAAKCAELEKDGYHHFHIFREIGVNEKIEQDYQYFFCRILKYNGFNKMQLSVALLDDNESGILRLCIYQEKTTEPDGTTSNVGYGLDAHAYVKPQVMRVFLNMMSNLKVQDWENKSWGYPIHDLFFVLKETEGRKDTDYHKYYISPNKDIYKKFLKSIQKICFESLKPFQYRIFTSELNSDDKPFYRETMHISESKRIFSDIEHEQKEMKEVHFDLAGDIKND